ncbi:hypothetical protein [Stygiolobus caldivivus]|uniref:Uncharacterized protein n=1 Tax=Stygiolobus caldivivus TaxID=2824673 RepID=A0A8D5U6K6_9CREN|nr:hypothetical protein [Stygiolobus caldivivus]BCU70010.1 hypothetical protein KN1_13070 [Stygiolobus caldivivus]
MIGITYGKKSIASVNLQPYTAEVFKLSNLSLLKFNSSIEINETGISEVRGANNISFLWISNGELPVVGLPPGKYNITNTKITETVVVQNVTNTYPQPVYTGGEIAPGGIGEIAPPPPNTEQPNYIPVILLIVLMVCLVIVLVMMRKRK